MDRGRAVVVGALAGLAFGGCGGVAVPVARSTVEADLPQKSSPIVVGESQQTDVRSEVDEQDPRLRLTGRLTSEPATIVFGNSLGARQRREVGRPLEDDQAELLVHRTDRFEQGAGMIRKHVVL